MTLTQHILISVLLFFQRCCTSNVMATTSEEIMEDGVGGDDIPTATLSNGIEIPLVGLGCASGVRKRHVESALEVGYRFLDTAQSYNWGYHEDEVGSAAQAYFESNNNNNKVFIQTKIHPEDLGYDATKRAVEISLKRLQVEQIDSVLIHKPRCWEGACRKEPEGTWQESWKALEEFYQAGTIRAIGICDVHDSLLDELLQQKIPPHIIQNWMDPIHQDLKIRRRCQQLGIQYQAYSTLGTQWIHHRGYRENPVLKNPTLLEIANKYNVDVAQVIINWATIHHKISVLPASKSTSRQRSNLIQSFDFQLTAEEVQQIDALDGKLPKQQEEKQKHHPSQVHIKFENQSDGPMNVYWINESTKEEISIRNNLEEGDSFELETYYGHKFLFKDAGTGLVLNEYIVLPDKGKNQHHIIGGRNEL